MYKKTNTLKQPKNFQLTMPLTKYQTDELAETVNLDSTIIALRFPGGGSKGILYADWIPFYVWSLDKETQKMDVAPVPHSQKKDYHEKPFTFSSSQIEDYRVITPELLVNIDPKDKDIMKNLRRFIRLEGLVRYNFGNLREHSVVGRIYGVNHEAMKGYINLGMSPSTRLSTNIPNSLKKRRSLIISRRKELIGKRFNLDTVLTFPIEPGNFSLYAILLERSKKVN